MKVGKNVVDVLLVDVVAQGGHQAPSMNDGCGDAFIRCRGSAGKRGLLKDAEQGRPVQRSAFAVVMAGGAACLEDIVAVGLLGI